MIVIPLHNLILDCGASITPRPGAFHMCVRPLTALIVGMVLLTGGNELLAQHGGGRGKSRPFICIFDCRDLEDADMTRNDLKRFDQILAMQATPEQSARFAANQQDVQAAANQLKALRQLLEKNPAAPLQPDSAAALSQSLDKVRDENRRFLALLSPAQSLGLKDYITKLGIADAELSKQMTALNQAIAAGRTNASVPTPASASVVGVTANLDKGLTNLQSEQIALAREMSIVSSEDQDLTFHFPQVTTSADIAGQKLSIPAAGEAIRRSVAEGRSQFDLRVVVDLSDLQESVSEIFRPLLSQAPRCGQRIEVRDGMLVAQSVTSLAVLHLHYERWVCPPGAGGGMLVAESDATVEIGLTPSVDRNGDLHLAGAIGRVQGSEAVRDALTTDPLGETLAEKLGGLVLSVAKKGADPKTTLPPVAREAATMQKARFQAGGAGQLQLVLDGQLQFSDEQTKELAAQLKQQLSAQATQPTSSQ